MLYVCKVVLNRKIDCPLVFFQPGHPPFLLPTRVWQGEANRNRSFTGPPSGPTFQDGAASRGACASWILLNRSPDEP